MLYLLISPSANTFCRSRLWGPKSPEEEVDLIDSGRAQPEHVFDVLKTPRICGQIPEEEVSLLLGQSSCRLGRAQPEHVFALLKPCRNHVRVSRLLVSIGSGRSWTTG